MAVVGVGGFVLTMLILFQCHPVSFFIEILINRVGLAHIN